MNRLTLKNRLNRYRFFGKSRKKQLIGAIIDNNIRLVNALINDGVNINYQDNKKNTPLIIALLNNNTDIANILLSRPDINVNIQNNHGDTAFFVAIAYKNNYIATILGSRSDINVNLQNDNNDTALTISIFNKNDELTKKLLERDDIDVNLQTKHGNTALILASEKNIEIVRLLLAKDGINLNLQNTYGNTALMAAKGPDANRIIEVLLGMPDINVNIQNNEGNTVLIDQLTRNNTEVVKLLLARTDIDVNIQNNLKLSALMIAISNNNTELAKLLLGMPDINIFLKDNQGHTVLYYAIDSNNTEIIKLIFERPDIDNKSELQGTLLLSATHNNNTTIAKMLLAMPNIDVNVQSTKGFTALINTIHHNNTEIVKLLLAMPNIDVNVKTKNGFTALINAVSNNNTEIIRLLISKKVKKSDRELDIYIDAGGIEDDIIDYLSDKKNKSKWKGVNKSFIQNYDVIFNITPDKYGNIPAANVSTCPICLSYTIRSEGCMYMSHDCKYKSPYFHRGLYDQYSYIDKYGNRIVEWCTICGRISDHHRHFPLLSATDPKPNPDYLPMLDAFGNNCIGLGGGGLPEKLSRFTEYRSILLSLQDQVGKIHKVVANRILIEAVWNAPLNDIPDTMNKPPGWNAILESFPNKEPENMEEIPDIPPPPYLVSPTSDLGTNNIIGLEDQDLIIFTHKQKDGSIKKHSYAVVDFVDFITTMIPERPKFGLCMYNPACDNCLHPEEVRHISENLGKLAHAKYIKYKEDFNRFFKDKESPCYEITAGGENDGYFELIKATDAVCLLPRSSTRRFRKTRSKKRA